MAPASETISEGIWENSPVPQIDRLEPNGRADHAGILVCRRLADIVDANLPGVLADADSEFLHDLRVAVRRTRSVVKEIKGMLPSGHTKRSRADLRWIQEITGPTRDLDVLLERWPSLAAAAAPSVGGDLAPVHELLCRHRADAFARMRRRLTGRRFENAWAAWRELIDSPLGGDGRAGAPIAHVVGRRVAAVYRSIVRAGSAIDDGSSPDLLHDLRKRGKELRYLLELFGDLWPAASVEPLVSALKDLQDVLGRFQDDEIQSRYLRALGPELAGGPAASASLAALDSVIDALDADRHRARVEFAERFTPFAAEAPRELVRETFGTRRKRS